MTSSTRETVLVLGKELEQRVAAAARLCGLDPGEFILRAVRRRVAEALGELGELDDPRNTRVRTIQAGLLLTRAEAGRFALHRAA